LDNIGIGQHRKEEEFRNPLPTKNKNEDPEEGREDKPPLPH
jgi:hypothetical protein